MKFRVLFFLLLFGIPSLFAQQPAFFFLGENEFEGVQIYDVIQDNELNYWFATDQGFYEYNCYTYKKVDCSEMKGLSAFGFVKNKNGVIFCYNLNNQIIKIQNDSCSVLYELKESERSSDVYLSVTPDDNLIVLTRTVLMFDSAGKQLKIPKVRSNYYGFPFLTKEGTTISHMSSKDSLLIIDKNKISYVQIKSNSEKVDGVLKFFKMDALTYAVNVSSVNKEMYLFDEKAVRLTKITHPPVLSKKGFFRFYSLNNQLWIAGAKAGVNYLKDVNDQTLSETMYSDYMISDVFKDSEGNVLLSTFNHGVLVIPNFEIPDVLSAPEVQSVISIENGDDSSVLMGTLKGELVSFQKNQYKILSNSGTRPVQTVFNKADFPFVIFDDGYIKAYNKKSGETLELIKRSLKDAVAMDNKTVYLASNTGICKLTFDERGAFKEEHFDALRMRTYSIEIDAITKSIYAATSDGLKILKADKIIADGIFKNEKVFANDIAREGNSVYVSTKDKGILVFQNDVVVQQIIPKLNQKEIEIYKLIVQNDKLYTLSAEGFAVFNKKGEVSIQLNKVQGFATNKIFDFEIINNQLWIIHSKGIQKLSIEQLQSTTETPLIKLAKIEVNDRNIKELTLFQAFENNQRKFRFTISSPTLRNKENIKYQYKLLGYDEKWLIGNYNENEIVYNALGPGNYTFVIKAENRGKYSNSVSYSFSILSPIYMRWWFIVGCSALVILMITFIYRYQLNAQRKKSEIINELNFSKLTAIQSQMNPHFIFNALNSIQDLVLKGDIDNSYTFITKFSNLVRRTLNYSDKDFIDFEQEVKLLELYLSLEKLRFKKELDYTITIDNKEDIMIPPLLIQPFIENALVHGLLHKEGNKKLSIHFRMEESLICIIEDNGVGREKAKAIKVRQRSEHESFSSKAILKRFEILSNVMNNKFGYVYEDLHENNVPTGTRVTLTIPVKHKF